MGSAESSETGAAPTGVGWTSLPIALARANESQRRDRLFDDPYAQAFLSAAPEAVRFDYQENHTEEELLALFAFGAVIEFHMAVRTRFFDDFLASAAATCPQVVLLAAGLDTRAYRLGWPPGVHLFELDQQEVLAFKESVLSREGAQSRCQRTTVTADLAQKWGELLVESGFDPSRPSAWLAEGLMLYLTSDQAAHLLATIGDLSAPGSALAYEHGPVADDELTAQVVTTAAMRPSVAMWNGGLSVDPVDWLAAAGWHAELRPFTPIGADYGRESPAHTAGAFVTATRQ